MTLMSQTDLYRPTVKDMVSKFTRLRVKRQTF